LRIVLDTNVLVSALLNPFSPPARILDLVLGGRIQLLLDDRIVDEYRRVLLRDRFGFARRDVANLLFFLAEESEMQLGEPLPPSLAASLPDATDLAFLEVAISGSADALVTGNLRHFPAAGMPGAVPCESPAAFLARFSC
jgi:uncharacterized protein